MEALTDRQLTELEKQATESFKKKKLDFFEQPGIKQNFPWLSENVTRLKIATDRTKKVDSVLIIAYLTPFFISAYNIFQRGLVTNIIESNVAELGVYFLSVLGCTTSIIRQVNLESPIRKAYELVVGKTTTETVEEVYKTAEMKRLNQMITGVQGEILPSSTVRPS